MHTMQYFSKWHKIFYSPILKIFASLRNSTPEILKKLSTLRCFKFFL